MRSYLSWIGELRGKSPVGIERCRYACEHLGPGEALVLVRERAEAGGKHAVSYRHRDVHLGYVPRRHRWIADAIDDGLRLLAIGDTVKTGWVAPQVIVGYENIQFTKTPNVLRGLGLTHLTKNENAQRELAEKGMAVGQGDSQRVSDSTDPVPQ